MIPRRDARRTSAEWRTSPEDRLFPTPGCGPARKSLTAPSEPSTRRCVTAESLDGAVDASGIVFTAPGPGLRSPDPAEPWGGSADGIGARLAGTESVPEPAKPLPLLGIGPDHQMLPAPDA